MDQPRDEFKKFPKIGRWSRTCVITEKIDGANAQIYIGDDGRMLAGSRNRWVTPGDDNFGFAKWVSEHQEELMLLGPGRHYGEWLGPGIQRGYGIANKRFSLFNVGRWSCSTPDQTPPACSHVVPIICIRNMDGLDLDAVMVDLQGHGSFASPGFMRPEGIVVYHSATGSIFKKTFDSDDFGKEALPWKEEPVRIIAHTAILGSIPS